MDRGREDSRLGAFLSFFSMPQTLHIIANPTTAHPAMFYPALCFAIFLGFRAPTSLGDMAWEACSVWSPSEERVAPGLVLWRGWHPAAAFAFQPTSVDIIGVCRHHLNPRKNRHYALRQGLWQEILTLAASQSAMTLQNSRLEENDSSSNDITLPAIFVVSLEATCFIRKFMEILSWDANHKISRDQLVLKSGWSNVQPLHCIANSWGRFTTMKIN